VLACVLLDHARITEVAAALEPDDFAGEANHIIYEAMLRLHSAGKFVAFGTFFTVCEWAYFRRR